MAQNHVCIDNQTIYWVKHHHYHVITDFIKDIEGIILERQ
jgi:hypothetical protein